MATNLSKSASPENEKQFAMPRFIETKLINVAASVARREYMPNLEKCRTINDARGEVARCDDKHADLAHKLKTIADELQAAEPRRDERELYGKVYSAIVDAIAAQSCMTCRPRLILDAVWPILTARASAAPPANNSTEVHMTAQQFYSEIWIKQNADDPRGDWPIRFAEAYHEYLMTASLPQPSLPQENADSLNTNSVAGDGLKTTPSAGQPGIQYVWIGKVLFDRYYIRKCGPIPQYWTGSQWALLSGEYQLCNFDTQDEAVAYAIKAGFHCSNVAPSAGQTEGK